MEFDKSDTALVVIDLQNDVLSETGVSWGLVGESIKENNTVENLERNRITSVETRVGSLDVVPLPRSRNPRGCRRSHGPGRNRRLHRRHGDDL